MHPSQIKGEAKIISSAKPLKQGLEQKKRHKFYLVPYVSYCRLELQTAALKVQFDFKGHDLF